MRHGISALLAAGALCGLLAAPADAATTKLVATVRPGGITLATAAGKRVKSLRSGTYVIVVHDRTARDNFHLPLLVPEVGPKTTVAFVGTKQWTVTFRPGLYKYLSDAHPTTLVGTFRVT